MENKNCQNCKKDFNIEADDFSFYEKIGVPAPTFCPECRFVQRYAFRNNIRLYKRDCDLCNTSIVSMYSSEKPFPVYCKACFFSDKWDADTYGMEYDFAKPFFEQWDQLCRVTPRLALIGTNQINSDYTNHTTNCKNSYLSFSLGASEDCYYCGPQNVRDKNCVSISTTRDSEWGYNLIDCEHCYRVSFAQNCSNCINSTLLYNCSNCQECVGCVNLRNCSYYIFNVQYSKDEYAKKIKELKLESWENFQNAKKEFDQIVKSSIHRFANIINSVGVTGDNIINSKNCKECFEVFDSENSKFCVFGNASKDCYDVNHTYPSAELCYQSNAPISSSQIFFSCFTYANCLNLWYSDGCYTTKNCFGSISLRNKSYVILNKIYSKEEYDIMVDKIKEQMKVLPYTDKNGLKYSFGDFFPMELSPFAYNESVAQDYFSLSKQEILERNLSWKDQEEKNYKITIFNKDIPDSLNDVSDAYTKETFECAHKNTCTDNCTNAFRIMPDELIVYKKLNIPLPRLCPNCRNKERTNIKNPFKLWHRKCMNEGCSNEFETSYPPERADSSSVRAGSPERAEIIYCESCYLSEIM